MCNFRVGQKVVCINGGPSRSGLISPLIKGAIYTITTMQDGIGESGKPTIGLKFAEIPTMPEFPNGYSYRRFRPVVERQTDISIFTAMLNKPRVRIEA